MPIAYRSFPNVMDDNFSMGNAALHQANAKSCRLDQDCTSGMTQAVRVMRESLRPILYLVKGRLPQRLGVTVHGQL